MPLTSSSKNKSRTLGITKALGVLNIVKLVPVSYVQDVCEGLIVVLKALENVRQNDADIVRVVLAAHEIALLLQEELRSHSSEPGPIVRESCERFHSGIRDIVAELGGIYTSIQKHSIVRYLEADQVKLSISQIEGAIANLRANLILVTTLGTRLEISQLISNDVSGRSLMADIHKEIRQQPKVLASVPPALDDIRTTITSALGEVNIVLSDIRKNVRVFDGRWHRILECDIDVISDTDYRHKNATDNGHLVYRTCIARVGNHEKEHTIRIFARKSDWTNELNSFRDLPRHPNLVQLYGVCDSHNLRALVFNRKLITLEDHVIATSLSAIDELKLRLNAIRDHQDVHNFLVSCHRIMPATFHHGFYYVNDCGAISIDDFEDASADRNWYTPLLINKSRPLSVSRSPVGVMEPSFDLLSRPISRESLISYYNLVLWLPSVSVSYSKASRSSVNIVSLAEGKCLATLEQEDLERAWSLKSLYIHVDDAVVSLSNGGIRVTIALEQSMNFTLFCHLDNDSFLWSFHSYFAQFSYVAKRYDVSPLDNCLHITSDALYVQYILPEEKPRFNHVYLFLPPATVFSNDTSSTYYFAYDMAGTKHLSPAAITASGLSVAHSLRESIFPHDFIPREIMVRRYQLLNGLHKMCGFDPTSLDIVEYLELPLFKISSDFVESKVDELEPFRWGRLFFYFMLISSLISSLYMSLK